MGAGQGLPLPSIQWSIARGRAAPEFTIELKIATEDPILATGTLSRPPNRLPLPRCWPSFEKS